MKRSIMNKSIITKSFAFIFSLLLLILLVGCNNADNSNITDNSSALRSDDPAAETTMPELEKTDWPAVSTDAEAFDLNGGFDNPNFENVFNNIDTVPLDQLVAFSLAADAAASEGASEELRSRFLEAPNTVLSYLVLMGDQKADPADNSTSAEIICRSIASADAAWHDGSAEFTQTMEACRANYPGGQAAKLLDVMEEEHKASMERNNETVIKSL